MISFEATAFLFLFLLIFVMPIDFSSGALEEYATYLLEHLMKFLKFPQNTVIAGINTGLGIVLGNWIINSVKYRNLIKDISKVFDLVVTNQIDDLHNIQMACDNIKGRLTTHAGTIIGSQNDPSIIVPDSQRTVEERRGLLKDTAKIKDRESTIRDDDLYKGKLDDIKLFKSSNLEILVKYFRKLKVVLEDLKNFTSYELPSSIEEFDTFNWRSSEIYKNRTNFLITRINIVICLGLMTKPIFNRFDMKARKDLSEAYQLLSNFRKEIQDNEILKEDFDMIEEFVQRNKLVTQQPNIPL